MHSSRACTDNWHFLRDSAILGQDACHGGLKTRGSEAGRQNAAKAMKQCDTTDIAQWFVVCAAVSHAKNVVSTEQGVHESNKQPNKAAGAHVIHTF